MLRLSTFVLLALIGGGISTSYAASGLSIGSSNTPAPPPPRTRGRTATFKDPTLNTTGQPDDVLKNYLTGAQRSDFDEALAEVKKANSLITTANLTLSRPLPAKTGFDTNAEEARKRAGDDVVKGQQMLTDIATKLQSLRKIALTNMEKSKTQATETANAVYAVTAGQWPGMLQSMADKTYGALAEQGYKRVYLLGVYALGDSKYAERVTATDQVREALLKADKDKSIFLPKQNWTFSIISDKGAPVIDYRERNANQQGNVKAAVVLGELVYEPNSGYAAFALRAMDLNSWKVVASSSAMFSVEPVLGKMLGLSSINVPSKPVTLAAGEKPPTALSMKATDPANVLGKTKSAGGTIRIVSSGANATPENRFAVFAVKSYLSDQAGVTVSDADLLAMILSVSQPDPLARAPGWIVPELKSLDDASFDTGIVTGSGEKVKITVTRSLPKLTAPSATDLKAGGYVLGGGAAK